MGLDGDVVSKRGNRSGDPREITKELLDPDGFGVDCRRFSMA